MVAQKLLGGSKVGRDALLQELAAAAATSTVAIRTRKPCCSSGFNLSTLRAVGLFGQVFELEQSLKCNSTEDGLACKIGPLLI